jgi:hypothetical protein
MMFKYVVKDGKQCREYEDGRIFPLDAPKRDANDQEVLLTADDAFQALLPVWEAKVKDASTKLTKLAYSNVKQWRSIPGDCYSICYGRWLRRTWTKLLYIFHLPLMRKKVRAKQIEFRKWTDLSPFELFEKRGEIEEWFSCSGLSVDH